MLVQIKNVSKVYKKHKILDIDNLTIDEGRIYGIVGKNGAGKTTLFRLLAGLTFPTTGEICYAHSDDRMGIMIEYPAIDGNMTAEENMVWMSKVYAHQDCRDIEDVLCLVNLEKTGTKKVKNFSLGMKQRLGIAMCLLSNPKVMVLDEPMNGLDPEGMIEFREILQNINKTGTTLLISSHLLDELYRLATDYIFVKDGKIVQKASLEEIEEKNESVYHMVTSDNLRAAQILKENFGCPTHSKDDGLEFKLENHGILEISRCLANEKIYITGLTETKFDLEAYYMEVVGE